MTPQQRKNKMEFELDILKDMIREVYHPNEAILSATLGLLHGALTNLNRIADALERPHHVGGPL
jgi:hypothetical protein